MKRMFISLKNLNQPMDGVHLMQHQTGAVGAQRLLSVLLMVALVITLFPLSPPAVTAEVHSHSVTYVFSSVAVDGPPHMPFSVEGTYYGALGSSAYALPMTSELVELPIGAVSLLGLRITSSEPIYLGEFDLPALSYGNSKMSSVQESGSSLAYSGPIYERNGVPLMPLSVTPISYDPSGRAWFHEEVTVEILYEKSSDALPLTGDETLSLSSSYDMLIVTSTELKPEFDRLQRWRDALGIDTHVVTTSQVAIQFPDRGMAEAIRAFVWHQHNVSGIQYLLLGGDANVIPAHKITITAGDYTEQIPADIYYGAFGGNVDWSTDFHPYVDVAMGRVPVSTLNGASNYVDKVIAYESRTAGDGYLKNVLFLGEKLDSRVWGGDVKDTNEQFVPDDFEVTKLYERDNGKLRFNPVRAEVEDAHIINNMGHGDYDFLATLRSSNVANIDNTAPFIWYSQGCNVGGFDRNPCVSNVMLADDKNSVANIVNSRFGWYISGPNYPIGPSNLYDKAFMGLVFESDGLLGDIHHEAKLTQVANLSNQYIRWVYATLNLLGDPALKVGGYAVIPSLEMTADGNEELTVLAQINGWEGNGSEANPFIITNGSYKDDTLRTIHLLNTSLHVRIEGNEFLSSGIGIELNGTSNVTVINNTFRGKDVAIRLVDSLSILQDNILIDNTIGVEVSDADVLVENNSFVNGNGNGIISEQSVLEVRNNIFSRSSGYAVSVQDDGSTFMDNSFVENNGTVVRVKGEQVWNQGANVWLNNWWSDISDEDEYLLGGEGEDPSPREDNINDAPEFIGVNPPTAASNDVMNLSATAVSGITTYSASVNSGAYCTLLSPLTQAGDLCLSFGENNVTVKAYSTRGNLGILDLEIDYLVQLPNVTITSPATFYINNSAPLLQWEMEDDSNLSNYSYSINDGQFLNTTSATAQSSGLQEGQQILRLRAYDQDGNYSFARKAFFVDTVAPTVTISTPRDGGLIDHESWDIRWSTYDPGLDSSGISHIILSANGTEHNLSAAARNLTVDLENGEVVIRVTVHDMAGNNASASVTVQVDHAPPQIIIDTPPGHPLVGMSPTLWWNVSDEGSGIDRVLMRIDGGATVDVTGTGHRTFTGLSNGYHIVEVIAYDAIGNRAESSIGLVIGDELPILDFTSPRNGHAGSPATITWDVWGGGDYTFGYSVAGVDTLTGSSKEASILLDEGTHSISIWAYDDVADVNLTRTMDITVSDNVPDLQWSSPTEGQDDLLFDRPMLLLYDLVTKVDRDSVQVVLRDDDGHRIIGNTTWTVNGTIRFTPDLDLENPQGFTLTVEGRDLAGRAFSDTITFSTATLTVPGRPINLQATGEANWLGVFNALTWEKPFDDGGYPVEESPLVYNVYRSDGEGTWTKIGNTTKLQYNDRQGLVPGQNYSYYLTVSNIIGESGPSLSDDAQTAQPLEGLDLILSALYSFPVMVSFNLAVFMMLANETSETVEELWNVTVVLLGPMAEAGWEYAQMGLEALQEAIRMASEVLVEFGESQGYDMEWMTPQLLTMIIAIPLLSFLIWRLRRSRLDAQFLPPEKGSNVMTEAELEAQYLLRQELEELDELLALGEIGHEEHRRRSALAAERLSALHLASMHRNRR